MPVSTIQLITTLERNALVDARSLAAILRRETGTDIRKRDINPMLYGDPRIFERTSDTPPRWRLRAEVSAGPADGQRHQAGIGRTRGLREASFPGTHEPRGQETEQTGVAVNENLQLARPLPGEKGPDVDRSTDATPQFPWPLRTPPSPHGWQQQAFSWWRAQGRRGIVEAVTGTGKTRVGIAAIADALSRRERVLVLVPTIVLQQQWARHLSELLPKADVFLLGGNARYDLDDPHDVVVAVINSAAARNEVLADGYSLLVADECHRYGAPMHQLALLPSAEARLGLTATLERIDDAVDTVLRPYFGASYIYGFDRAAADSVLASFVVADVGVRLSDDERVAFEAADEACRRARGSLIHKYGYPEKDFGEFFARAAAAAKRFGMYGEPKLAKTFISSFHERSRVLAESPARIAALAALAPAIERSGRVLVFTETVDAADKAVAQLRRMGIRAAAYHTGVEADARAITLARFGEGGLQCIVAVKALDEGVDVPDADLAIVMAASKSKRQMIQRLGRVVRKKADGRYARLAILFAENTNEDPLNGAHEAFRDVIEEAADEIMRFGPDDWDDALEFLDRFAGPLRAAIEAYERRAVASPAAPRVEVKQSPVVERGQATSPSVRSGGDVDGSSSVQQSSAPVASRVAPIERLLDKLKRAFGHRTTRVAAERVPPPPVPETMAVAFDATRDTLRLGHKEFELGRDLTAHQSGQTVDYRFRGERVASLVGDGGVPRMRVVVGGRPTDVLELADPTLEVKQAALALAIAIADTRETRRLERLGAVRD